MRYFLYLFRGKSSDKFISKPHSGTMVSLIYDQMGNRKYLTPGERNAFLVAARRLPLRPRLFCTLLAYTGARLSEALAITPERIDVEACVVIIECLKKRRPGVFRAVPVPTELAREVSRALRARPYDTGAAWGFGRTTAWKVIKRAMRDAGINGVPASPKGLRHSFAVSALQSGVPINMVAKWLGHSRIQTTAIYADAVGQEERSIATRFWRSF